MFYPFSLNSFNVITYNETIVIAFFLSSFKKAQKGQSIMASDNNSIVIQVQVSE